MLWRIDLRDDKHEGREETRFEESQEYSTGDDLAVAVHESSSEGDDAPANDGNGQYSAGSKLLDG